MQKRYLLLLLLILCIPFSLAATIHGTIYDISLEEAVNVRVSVDTSPTQLYISKNGFYSFQIPPGDYTITAEQYSNDFVIASTQEPLTISDQGEYVVDLILLPVFEESEDSETEFIDDSTDEIIDKPPYNMLPAIIILILICLILIYLFLKKNKQKPKKQQPKKKTKNNLKRKPKTKKPKTKQIHQLKTVQLPKDLSELYEFIRKHKRTTQKEIRKTIPLSEAKISLMITDLESRNLIKKIKKGRGNIIILKN